jgi:ribosome recycling factor
MSEEVKMVLDETKSAMQVAITHLETELVKVRAGRATPSIVENVLVEYYGSRVPISQVSNISTTDARTIKIQPWEKSMLGPIAEGITHSNLSLNPQNNGEMIIISIPPLTEERRKELVKKARAEGETAKVSIRTNRKEGNDFIKSLQKSGLTEDEAKGAEEKIQELTNSFISKVDALLEAKEKDIMTV